MKRFSKISVIKVSKIQELHSCMSKYFISHIKRSDVQNLFSYLRRPPPPRQNHLQRQRSCDQLSRQNWFLHTKHSSRAKIHASLSVVRRFAVLVNVVGTYSSALILGLLFLLMLFSLIFSVSVTTFVFYSCPRFSMFFI